MKCLLPTKSHFGLKKCWWLNLVSAITQTKIIILICKKWYQNSHNYSGNIIKYLAKILSYYIINISILYIIYKYEVILIEVFVAKSYVSDRLLHCYLKKSEEVVSTIMFP